jgi:SAM-dependent methyltransferase
MPGNPLSIPAQAWGRLADRARREWRFYHHLRAIPHPRERRAIPHDPADQRALESSLREHGFTLRDLVLDPAGYRDFLDRARYDRFQYRQGGAGKNFAEKSLEHYVAAFLLELAPGQVYIDIANLQSPTPEIYAEIFGVDAYRQDLRFPEGLHGKTIGGDAGRMPLPDGFADRMALHCSFEHFEGDADVRFAREAGRVLRPGGRVCILPLYLYPRYAVQTDPAALPTGGIAFENDATIFIARGWNNRHGRFYDVPHLQSRLLPALAGLKLTILIVRNEKEIAPACYLKFIALLEKA